MNYTKKIFVPKLSVKEDIQFHQRDKIYTNMTDISSFVLSFWITEKQSSV